MSTAIQTEPSAVRDERDTLERRYVRGVLGRYLWLPGTPVLSSRHDRRLAQTLFERGVTLIFVEAALLLGAARRALREPYLAPLPRLRRLQLRGEVPSSGRSYVVLIDACHRFQEPGRYLEVARRPGPSSQRHGWARKRLSGARG